MSDPNLSPLSEQELLDLKEWNRQFHILGFAPRRSDHEDRDRLIATIDARDETIKQMVVQFGRIAQLHRPVIHEPRGGRWFCPICGSDNEWCAATIGHRMLEFLAKNGALDNVHVPAADRARNGAYDDPRKSLKSADQ